MWRWFPLNTPTQRRRFTQLLGIILAGIVCFNASPRASAAPMLANVTGTVFRDFNNNGTRDTREPGIVGVTVTGTDQSGATANATTATGGTYTLTGLTGMVRVEFTLPTSLNYLQPAAAGGSLVQFVDATSATAASVGFFNPSDFTGANPRLATTIFRRADNTGITDSAIDDYPYTADNTFGNFGAHQVMNANTGGTLYGLAYQRTTDRLYSGSYIRRGASLGSTESTGAIYRTTTPTGTPGTALLINVNGLTYNAGANTINTGTNPHPKATTNNWGVDATAYAATGKRGLGDLEISDDDLTLYAVNLNQRAVVVLPFNADKITVNTGAVTQVTIPNMANCDSTTVGQVRPFGLKFNDGFLYVGAVCTAETSNTITDLRAYVFQFNPTTRAFVTTPVLEFPLTYTRRHINGNFGTNTNNTADGEWRPWSDTWRPTDCYGCADGDLWGWPQPILTDIEFDGEGFMMLGLRDRLADQAYYEQDPGPNNGTMRQTRNGGDLLLACQVSGIWTLENAGGCNGRTTGDPNSGTGGNNRNSGPGGREFYYDDNFDLSYNPDYHRDTELGSLALIKGRGEIVTTLYDTFATFEAGTVTLNNDTGSRVRAAQLYPEGATFGKAGGIGDVELLAAPAPIEIGNRLWRDTNGNGVQDPNESGLAGVTIQLYSGATLIGTAVTNLNGNYLFSSDTSRTDVLGADYGITQMIAGAALQIRVVPTAGQNANALSGLALTTVDANSGTNSDVRDSDATFNGTYTLIAVTLGTVGQNNHTYDIGYTPLGTIGNRVWLDEDSNGYQDEGEAGIANVTVQLKNSAGTVIATTVTDSNGNYIFKNLPAATYFVQVLGNSVATGLTQTTIYPNAGADETNQNQSTGNGYQIVLGVAQNNLTADFGYNWNTSTEVNTNTGTAALGDCVWIDADGDGAQDPNEAGIAGVTVTLITAGPDNLFGTSDDVTAATTTTSATGCYIFDNLQPGAYVVRVTPPAGYTQTGDPDHWGTTGANDNQTTVPVILGPGDVFLDADFGYQPTAGTFGSIGNTVWFDVDGDGCGPNTGNGDGSSGNCGTPDAESPIAGVTVVLIRDTNNNGTWDAGEPIIATDITDATGQYLFPGLPIADGTGTDDYLVYVNDTYNALNGLTPTYDQNGVATPNISRVADLTATPVTNQDFGYNTDNSGQSGAATTLQTLPTGTDLPGGVGDRVWLDLNNNTTQDAGEPGIAGVQVNLVCLGLDGTLNTSDDIRQTVFTNNDGTYFFTDLPVNATGNSCTVTVVTSTLPGTLTQTYDANGLGTPNTSTISLTTANPVNTLQDFGYRGTGTIGNFVWRDTNANGVFDGLTGPDGIAGNDDDEIALAGVTLTLWYDRNANGKIDTGDTPINTLTTDANGAYLFTGLSTANTAYIVDVTDTAGVLVGYWHSLGTANTNNNSQVDPLAVTLTAAAPNYLNADFGYYIRGAALGNRVWFDANSNGLQDTGERGIQGVIVTLTIAYPGGAGTTTLATVTNGLGYYSFGNLLLDEDFNGTGTTPTHTISVGGSQVGLSGFGVTTIDVGSNANDLTDSDNPAGVVGTATKGLTTIPLTTTTPSSEPVRASYDFGYVVLGTIGNRVWLDEDSNGYQDEGEEGIANVTVQLKNAAGTVIATTVTDSNGNYIFKNLPAGNYFVQVLNSTIPSGMTQTTIYPNAGADETNQDQSSTNGYAVTLAAGGQNLTADFGYNWNPTNDVNNNANTATIGDCVWIDADGDGVQDPEEAGIAGVTVTLITAGADGLFGTADDVTAATTTTSATGCYIFDGLQPGAYVVRVTPPAGYTQTGDPDHFGAPTGTSTNDNQTTVPVVLGPGDVFLDADFGYQPNAGTFGSIGDTVWLDIDADGIGPANTPTGTDTNEPYIPNVTVVLIRDTNGNGTWDAGEPIIATDVTDANGFYNFPGLPITDGTGTDDYIVWVNDVYNTLIGLAQTYDANGIATPNISSVADLTATPVTNQDFGYVYNNTGQSGAANTTVPLPGAAEQPGRIGDRVWLDINADGIQTANEPGIPGVTVNLVCADGTTMSTVTGINGIYLFDNIPVSAGGNSCTVTVVNSTLPGNVTQTFDADGLPTPHASTVSLTTANPVNLNQDFGYRGTGTVGNLVWLDTNADGVFTSVNGPDNTAGTDDDEPLLAGVTVTLWYDRNGNGRIDTGDYPLGTQTTTNALVNGGNYLFSGLPTDDGGSNAQYIVDVTDTAGVLVGYWHSLGAAATNNNSQIDPHAVTLTPAAANYLNADFGYYVRGAALGNRVWNDDNGNGLQDTGEPGISGVVVSLLITYPGGATTTLNTVTNSAGYYSFANLLLDEDYNGTGTTPTHSIRVNTAQTNLSGYGLTTVDVGANANDLRDSDAYAGVAAIATKGLTTIPLSATDPVTEPTRASYDFGFVSTLDYGDLPNAFTNIQLMNDGARHVIGAIRLGTLVDADGDGAPTASANGDDTLDGNDDEDGVIKTPGSIWQAGGNGSLDIRVTGGTGFVSVWIDWNRDNDFADTGERVIVDRSITNSTQTVTFPIPAGTTFPAGSVLNIRARLYSATTSGNASPVGLAAGTGEVEDHQLSSAPLGVTLESFGALCRPTDVLASWVTLNETDVLGFNVWRGTNDAEPDTKLNSELIASQVPGGGQGASYELADATVTDGTYYYWLESVSMSGQTERFGPVSATFPCEVTAVTVGGFDATPATTLPWGVFAIGALLLAGIVIARRK